MGGNLEKNSKADLMDMYQDEFGKAPPSGATKARLIEMIQEGRGTSTKSSRAKVTTRSRSTTSARRSGSSASRSGGGSRARSAALAKSAPTVRMHVDERDLRPEPRPSSADILAVALVVFMSIIAACSSQFDKGKGGGNSYMPISIFAPA